ncbi:efflux RND transporter periplasmic adaptor subunit [Aquabacterium sp. OR-4]|uniref:efflux RND transporter periplasmic adaptor subunit n=1 Tax=Aquabacterium sp. OR-4 TaxID=2978127 RepID=UPI0021B457B5|nr:efflux RND transporter periplasmic adaptor subunit [Aquabacterium sp. OR-4]MDT7836239.1 efflux RND transporter periplasmic adaptor subunit [Aquabacterium sp. OR-4]
MSDPQSPSPTSAGTTGSGAAVADVIGAGASPGRRWAGWLLGAVLLAGLAAGAAWWWQGGGGTKTLQYRSSPATLGTLRVGVSATGNLEPINQVNVGSELSGTVEAVLVDDNDRVKKGQVLARLDTAKLEDAVAKSEAALAQAQAQVKLAQATTQESRASLARLQQVAQLSGGKVPAASELTTAEATLARAVASEASMQAAVQQAVAALRSDRTNLGKALIRSPIDGVVLAREVEPGQTVAASLQVATLFTLAENLAQMQLKVNVDEADVGQVKAGQSASFSVDAYAERRFPARILRVGLGSTTTNNVVSYATLLEVDNADLSLRPGMTATADITTLVREQALLVPNAALRWSPPAAAGAAGAGASGAPKSSLVSSLMPRPPGGAPRPGGNPAAGAAAKAAARSAQQTVWVLGTDGRPQPLAVTVGATDGKLTQVTGGALQAGQAVITDSAEASR